MQQIKKDIGVITVGRIPVPLELVFAPSSEDRYRKNPVYFAQWVHDPDNWIAWESEDESMVEVDIYPQHRLRDLQNSGKRVSFRFRDPGQVILYQRTGPVIVILCAGNPQYAGRAQGRSAEVYGIRADTGEDQSEAINRAVAALSQAGGGRLVFSPGEYRVTTINLASHVDVYLPMGAVWKANPAPEKYPMDVEDSSWAGLPRSSVPGARRRVVMAEGIENAGITGLGRIEGQGAVMRARMGAKGRALINLLLVRGCRSLRFGGIGLWDSEFWNTHVLLSQDIHFHDIKLLNEIPPRGWDAFRRPGGSEITWNNADGINPDSSSTVSIRESLVYTGDDCVPIKNTGCHQGRLEDCQDILVEKCLLATPVTAMKIGTETRGEKMKGIVFRDIDVFSAGRVIGTDLKDGAAMEDLLFENIQVRECNRLFDFTIQKREDNREQTRYSSLKLARINGFFVERYGMEGRWMECTIQGFDEKHRIEELFIRNLILQGEKLENLNHPLFRVGAWVDHLFVT